MTKYVYADPRQMGRAAAEHAGNVIAGVIEAKGIAHIILATGASQFETLHYLVQSDKIAWEKVIMFHLDEYIGLGSDHPAGFRKYLKERFVDKVSPLKAAYFIDGNAREPREECRRVGNIIAAHRIDVALVGIGENGHLAFNDPPADFETQEPFIIVALDQACRKQQLGEGWFNSLDEVPCQAISVSIRQIMKSKSIIVSAPDERKAEAVKNALEGPVSNRCPASILQQHGDCNVFLDRASASLLSSETAK